jgi:prefoldin subunit 5
MRLMQWQAIPSIADTLNKTTIDEIRTEIEEIKQRLTVLDERQRKLDEIIERGKQLKAIKDNDVKICFFVNIIK